MPIRSHISFICSLDYTHIYIYNFFCRSLFFSQSIHSFSPPPSSLHRCARTCRCVSLSVYPIQVSEVSRAPAVKLAWSRSLSLSLSHSLCLTPCQLLHLALPITLLLLVMLLLLLEGQGLVQRLVRSKVDAAMILSWSSSTDTLHSKVVAVEVHASHLGEVQRTRPQEERWRDLCVYTLTNRLMAGNPGCQKALLNTSRNTGSGGGQVRKHLMQESHICKCSFCPQPFIDASHHSCPGRDRKRYIDERHCVQDGWRVFLFLEARVSRYASQSRRSVAGSLSIQKQRAETKAHPPIGSQAPFVRDIYPFCQQSNLFAKGILLTTPCSPYPAKRRPSSKITLPTRHQKEKSTAHAQLIKLCKPQLAESSVLCRLFRFGRCSAKIC